MNLEETLAAFGPVQNQPLPSVPQGPAPAVDPVAEAIAALQQMGALTAPPPPPGVQMPQQEMQQPLMPPPPPEQGPQPFGVEEAYPSLVPPGGLGPLQPFGLDQGPATGTGPAPLDAAYPPPPPPPAPGSMEDVEATTLNAADAEFRAKQKRESDIATAAEDRLRDTSALQEQHIINRERDQAQVDLDQAGWIQEMQDLASREPNPGRYWENQSGLGKAIWAIGLIAGAAYVALTPGAQSAALTAVRREIDQDMEMQRQRLGKQLNALKAKGETMTARHARNATDMRDDYSMRLGRIDALERAVVARASVPGDLDAEAGKARAMQVLAQAKAGVIEERRKEAIRASEFKNAREHDTRMQGSRLWHQSREREAEQKFKNEQRIAGQIHEGLRAEQEFQNKLALSKVEVGASFTPGGAIPTDPKTGLPELFELHSGATPDGKAAGGVVLLGPDGKPAFGHGKIRVRDEDTRQKGEEMVTAANEMYTATQQLVDVLDSDEPGVLQALVGGTNPRMQGLMTKMGYATARARESGVLTNQDVSKGGMEKMGFDLNGKWLDRAKFVGNAEEIKAMLKKELADMPAFVTERLKKFTPPELNGQGTRAVWDPNMLASPELPEKNSADIRNLRPVTRGEKPVKGVKDYVNKRSMEAVDPEERGRQLPEHDSAPVRAIIAAAKGAGPETVKAKAAEVLDKLAKDRDALASRTAAAMPSDDPWRGPASGEDAAALHKQMESVENTIAIAKAVAEDAERKQAEALKDVSDKIEAAWAQGFVTEDWIRRTLKRTGGFSHASEEADALVKKFQDWKDSPANWRKN